MADIMDYIDWASSLPEYRIYMDFKAGGVKKDTIVLHSTQEAGTL